MTVRGHLHNERRKLPGRQMQEEPAIWQREKMKMEGKWFGKKWGNG